MNELGLDVEAYYASEINKDAMLVSSVHHDVTHIGDASLLTRAQVLFSYYKTVIISVILPDIHQNDMMSVPV